MAAERPSARAIGFDRIRMPSSTAAPSRNTDAPRGRNCSRIGRLKAASSSFDQLPPWLDVVGRTVASTLRACSPPITEMRALGHIHRKRGP